MIKIYYLLLLLFTSVIDNNNNILLALITKYKKESIYCTDKICTVWGSRSASPSLPSPLPPSHCPPPPPSLPLLHFAYHARDGVVAGSCAMCWHCGMVVGSCVLCWHCRRLAVVGPCIPYWGGATVGLVHGGSVSWWALCAMLGWCHSRACTWQVGIVGGSCMQWQGGSGGRLAYDKDGGGQACVQWGRGSGGDLWGLRGDTQWRGGVWGPACGEKRSLQHWSEKKWKKKKNISLLTCPQMRQWWQQVVIGPGNPWVFLEPPTPISEKTPTWMKGKGFLR